MPIERRRSFTTGTGIGCSIHLFLAAEIAAKFRVSWNAPWLAARSPMKAMATPDFFCILRDAPRRALVPCLGR